MMAYIRLDEDGVAHYASSTSLRTRQPSKGWCGQAREMTDKASPFVTCLTCLRMFDLTLQFAIT